MLIMLTAQYNFWFDSSNQYLPHTESQQESKEERAAQHNIFCSYCGNPVTSTEAVAEVDGSHEHFKTNPQHQQFVIRCYRFAAGCIVEGPAIKEFTWFTGHTWQIAKCGKCSMQLGWFFNGSNHFFGLIAKLLTSAQPN